MAESEDTSQQRCKQCGNDIIQTGKQGRPKVFCSGVCRNKFCNDQKNAIRSARSRAAWPIHCTQCRRAMEPAQNKTLCSNACKVAAYSARQPGYISEAVRREIAAIRRLPKLLHSATARLRAIRIRLEDRRLRISHACCDCGAALSGVTLKVRYCEACGTRRAKAHKRTNRAADKARRRQVTVERFDPIEVLERDGWRCHLCGIAAPKRLRGSYDDRAPELDHIIPIAAGGEHSRRNTACACRKCNIAKADRPLGQLRLVA